MPTDVVIPLKAYRFHRRKPTLTIGSGAITLYLPTYFGRRRWVIPTDGLAVVDLESVDDDSAFDDESLIVGGVVIPYLFTTGPATVPNVGLFFAERQRIPAVTWLTVFASNVDVGAGYFESRSEQGAFLDGVVLRFADPAATVDQLARSGAERVTDFASWLARHRVVATGARAQALDTRANRLIWLGRSQWLFVALAVGAWSLGGDDPATWLLALGGVAFLAAFGVRILANRLMTRLRREGMKARR